MIVIVTVFWERNLESVKQLNQLVQYTIACSVRMSITECK